MEWTRTSHYGRALKKAGGDSGTGSMGVYPTPSVSGHDYMTACGAVHKHTAC